MDPENDASNMAVWNEGNRDTILKGLTQPKPYNLELQLNFMDSFVPDKTVTIRATLYSPSGNTVYDNRVIELVSPLNKPTSIAFGLLYLLKNL